MATRVSARLSRAEGRKFALTLGSVFLLLAALLWWRDHTVRAMVAGALGALFVSAALTFPAHLGPVYRTWMGLGHAISKVMTPVVLGVVYFLVFTPIALVRKMAGKNALVHAKANGSFWVDRIGSETRSDLRRQF